MEASAEKSQHNQADDFETRVAEAVESRVAEAVEKHIQATRAKTKEILRQSMKRIASAVLDQTMEASAEKAHHDQATEPSDVESRLAEAIEMQYQAIRAKEIERHDLFMKHLESAAKSRLAKALEKVKLKASRKIKAREGQASRKTKALEGQASPKTKALKGQSSRKIKELKGMDYVDRGDYYEAVVKGLFINEGGRVAGVFRESRLKEHYILFTGVPPITVKYPKMGDGPVTISTLKDLHSNFSSQVAKTIREAPKEIHDAYRQAYYRAIKEYDERSKNKSLPDEDEEIEKIRDVLLSLAQIKADKIIRNEQIRADKLRASYRKANPKDVGNQSGQVDPQNVNVDLAAMLSVKATFEESDIEKQISNRRALAELKAKKCIAAAHAKADKLINFHKALLASRREKDPDEARKFDEAALGFKDNLSP